MTLYTFTGNALRCNRKMIGGCLGTGGTAQDRVGKNLRRSMRKLLAGRNMFTVLTVVISGVYMDVNYQSAHCKNIGSLLYVNCISIKLLKNKCKQTHFTTEDTLMSNEYMERCSTSFVIRKMQIQTTRKYHHHHLLEWLHLKD